MSNYKNVYSIIHSLAALKSYLFYRAITNINCDFAMIACKLTEYIMLNIIYQHFGFNLAYQYFPYKYIDEYATY